MFAKKKKHVENIPKFSKKNGSISFERSPISAKENDSPLNKTHDLIESKRRESVFCESQNLKDITNLQENHIESFEKDVNVMTLKELKQENEEELDCIFTSINKTKSISYDLNEKLSELQMKKNSLWHSYQEIIKNHAFSLQNLQGNCSFYKEKNEELTNEIDFYKTNVEIAEIEKETEVFQQEFLSLEQKIKAFQEKNEEKFGVLIEKLRNLNEEIVNYDEIHDFKRKEYEKTIEELKKTKEQKENELISDENDYFFNFSKEKTDFLDENEEIQKKISVFQKKRQENSCKIEELTKKHKIFKEKKAFIQKEHSELSQKKSLFSENLNILQEKLSELLKENEFLKISTQIPKKKTCGNGKALIKKSLDSITVLKAQKKELENSIKKLFDQKVKIENGRGTTGKKIEREKEEFTREMYSLKKSVEEQNFQIDEMLISLKSLKCMKEEESSLLSSLEIGLRKQNALFLKNA